MALHPPHVKIGAGAILERRRDLYAIRQPAGAATGGAVAVLADDTSDTFAVYRGTPPADRIPDDVGPVYSMGSGGPLAVPTGRVFVRLAGHVRAEERQAEFEAAGFQIEQTLSYAPNAAWLRPVAGGGDHAIPGADALAKLADVLHVEPQLLFERAFKS